MKCSITKSKNSLKKISVIILWIFIWQLISLFVNKDILLPAPIAVFKRLYTMLFDYGFWQTAVLSTLRIMEGFLSAVLLGTLLAIATCKSKFLNEIMLPLLNTIKATPVASFIILALVWIPSGIIPSFISFLMVLPMVWANLSQGITNVDKSLLEMAYVFKLKRFKKFKDIYIPSVLPYFMAACTTGLGFAWKSGVAAEVIANTKISIGSQIYKSKIYRETVDLFAWTVVVILISVVLEVLMKKLMKKVLLKYGVEKGAV